MRNIKHLNLSDNEFNKNDHSYLLKAIKSLVNLVSIALNNCEIGKEGIHGLFSVMKNFNYLREIYIAYNNMTDTGLQRIETDFSGSFNAITHLNVSGNVLGPNGAQYLSKFLADKNELQYIRFSSNKIKPPGLQQVLNRVEGKGKVKDVDIGDNLLGDAGADFLLSFLNHNKVYSIGFRIFKHYEERHKRK